MAVPVAVILNFELPTLPENHKLVLNNLLIIATLMSKKKPCFPDESFSCNLISTRCVLRVRTPLSSKLYCVASNQQFCSHHHQNHQNYLHHRHNHHLKPSSVLLHNYVSIRKWPSPSGCSWPISK